MGVSLDSATSEVDFPQVPALVRAAEKAIEEGKCVVIGLQSTGEARTQDVIAEKGEELDDFVSGPRVRVFYLSPTSVFHTSRACKA